MAYCLGVFLNRHGCFIKHVTNILVMGKWSSYNYNKEYILEDNAMISLKPKNIVEMCHKQLNESFVQWLSKGMTNFNYNLKSREINDFQGLKYLIISE